jgi:hypothetical protein
VMWGVADGKQTSLSRRIQLMVSRPASVGHVVGTMIGWGADDDDVMRAFMPGLERAVMSKVRPDWDEQMKRSMPLLSRSLDDRMHEFCLEVNQAWDSACYQLTESVLSLAQSERARQVEVAGVKAEMAAAKAEMARKAKLDVDRLQAELQRSRAEERRLKQAVGSNAAASAAETQKGNGKDGLAALRSNARRLLGLDEVEVS